MSGASPIRKFADRFLFESEAVAQVIDSEQHLPAQLIGLSPTGGRLNGFLPIGQASGMIRPPPGSGSVESPLVGSDFATESKPPQTEPVSITATKASRSKMFITNPHNQHQYISISV